jgi:HAMP domain-containing protein
MGPNNGFGWKAGETIGAQIVSVPESLPLQIADRALKTSTLYLVGVAALTLILLDLLLIFTVIRPVGKLSRMADEISKGNLDVEELPVEGGRDEISVLASSFNRMQRSLVRAMRMLESDEGQG